jgi:hypothetical protein
MDGGRFDALTKALASGSRRGFLRLLVTGALAPTGLGLRATSAAADCNVGGTPCNGNAECCSLRCVNGKCLFDPGQQCQTAEQCGTNRCEVVSTTVIPGAPKKKKKGKGKKGKRKKKGKNGAATTIVVRQCFCADGRRSCAGVCCNADDECAFPPNQTPACLSKSEREPGDFCTANAQCASDQCAGGACLCDGGSEPCSRTCCANGATCEEGNFGVLGCLCNKGTPNERAQCGEVCCPNELPTCNAQKQCCNAVLCVTPP